MYHELAIMAVFVIGGSLTTFLEPSTRFDSSCNSCVRDSSDGAQKALLLDFNDFLLAIVS